MPSIAIPASQNAVATATSGGNITITNAVNVYSGSWGWLAKTDGSNQVKVKVLSTSVSGTTTTCKLRVYPNDADEYGFGRAGTDPIYTTQDISAFNTGSALYVWPQSVPVDPAFSQRVFP